MHKETEDTSATESVGSISNYVVSEKKAMKVAKKRRSKYLKIKFEFRCMCFLKKLGLDLTNITCFHKDTLVTNSPLYINI